MYTRTGTGITISRVLVKRLQRIDEEMSGEARDMFRAYIEGEDLRKFATSLPRLMKDDFSSTMDIRETSISRISLSIIHVLPVHLS